MIRRFLLIINLLFILSGTAFAEEVKRMNNRLITSGWILSINKTISPAQAEKIVSNVFKEAKRHKIDPLLLLAIMRNESTFKSNAKSYAGARGLMQVLPKWHRDKIRGRNINDINVNIEVGTMIISDCLIKRNDHVRGALECYLGGRSTAYTNKIARSHKEIKETLVAQMLDKDMDVIILSNFNKPRQYHERDDESLYEKLIYAFNSKH